MADVTNFTDIPGLVVCFNAHDVAPTLNENNNVVAWPSSEGGALTLSMTVREGDANDTTYVTDPPPIGMMSAIRFIDAGNRQVLSGTLNPSLDVSAQGYTLAVLRQHHEQSRPTTRYTVGVQRTEGWGGGSLNLSSNQEERPVAMQSTPAYTAQLPRNDQTPEVVFLGCGAGADTGFFYLENAIPAGGPDNNPAFASNSSNNIVTIDVGARIASGTQSSFDVSIVALYNHALTTQERLDLYTLMASWRDNGESPDLQPPTITQEPAPNTPVVEPAALDFTAAAAGNPTPDLVWELSDDGSTGWGPISGLNSTIEAGSDTTGTLTVSFSDSRDDQKFVRMVATNTNGRAESAAAQININATVYPTSTHFGPVTCNDASAVLTWQWRADGNGTWTDIAPGVLSNYRIETGPGGPSVPELADGETKLWIDAGIVADSGQISCNAVTGYNAGGKRTNIQVLNVVEVS